ncbi:MAG: hypothetical protein AB7G75_28495 [Candidatus Binatia bacterium]
MGFSVKINSITKDPKIHRSDCHEVRKNKGESSYNQMEWQDFETREEGEAWGNAKGFGTVLPCKKCIGTS